MTRPKLVYFMKPEGADGPIKIGCTADTLSRLIDLSRWSPVPLEMVAAAEGNFALERFLHVEFDHARTHKEWFKPVPELLRGIALVRAGMSIEAAFGAVPVIKKSKRTLPKPERRIVYVKAIASEAAA